MFQTIKLSSFFRYFMPTVLTLLLVSCSKEHHETIPQTRTNFDEILEDPYLKKIAQENANNKIMVLLPLSGPEAYLGRSILDSCILAAKEANNSGIDFVVIDTADRTLDINKVFWKYNSNNLRAIIGPIFFNEARRYGALFPNIPMFTFSNNKDINNNHIFTCGISPQDETDEIFRYAKRSGKRDFLIMLPKGQQAEGIVKCLRKSMRKFGYSEGNEVEVIRYDYINSVEATRYVVNSGKRAVFVLESIIDVAELPKNVDIFTLSSSALRNEGMRNNYIFAFSNMQQLFDFIDRYKDTFGRVPTTLDMIGYDITGALCRSAQDYDAPFVLENRQLHGCLGDYSVIKNKGVKRRMSLYKSKSDVF